MSLLSQLFDQLTLPSPRRLLLGANLGQIMTILIVHDLETTERSQSMKNLFLEFIFYYTWDSLFQVA